MRRKYFPPPDLDDDGRLLLRFKSKRSRSKDGPGFYLTFQEYCGLMREARVVSSQLGNCGYHLARHGDEGPYAVGNCRFILWRDNLAEMDTAKISEGLVRRFVDHPGHFLGRSHRERSKLAIGRANRHSQLGARNSQFGTCWVHRGGVDKKIPRSGIAAFQAKGWVLGRDGAKFRKVLPGHGGGHLK